ncbi:MAG: hypothetical protein JW929_09360 [Anaerolineales bacterium]|nr:hypothetical protein [Anaerolineales bacterium]
MDCIFLEGHYCGAAAIELDPDTGCLTYSQSAETETDPDWEDDEFDDDWENEEEGFEIEEDEEDESWDEDEQ